MLDQFLKYCENLGIYKNTHLLVAVSGGIDSMCLLHLLQNSFQNIAVAHVNFKLRKDASDEDARFVSTYCHTHQIQYFEKSVETEKVAADNGNSIQETARMLRYEWFETLRLKYGFDYILTAHHFDDKVETFMINLARGGGAAGLASIPEENKFIKRPLLRFGKEELVAYARHNQIAYREDASNASDKYRRNAIRHNVLPALRTVFPHFDKGIAASMEHLKNIDVYLEQQAQEFLHNHSTTSGNMVQIKLEPLKHLVQHQPLWHYLFKNFGANPDQLHQIRNLVNSQAGKRIQAGNYMFHRERDCLSIAPLETGFISNKEWQLASESGKLTTQYFTLEWKVLPASDPKRMTKNHAYLEYSRLTFPLQLRFWKPGDRFRPLGMKGSKKVSDFLTDSKVSSVDRDKIPVLVSDKSICWIAGMRLSEDFAATEGSAKVLALTYEKTGREFQSL